MSIRQEIRRLAETQDLVVTTAQAIALGADPSWVRRQVVTGAWQRIHRGVAVVHSGPVPWRALARAGLLHAGDGAALSHRTAALVHGITKAPPAVIEISIPHDRRVAPSPGLVVRRRRTMPAAWGRLRAVDPAETTVDLLEAVTGEDDAVGLLTAAVRARVDPQRILDVVDHRRYVRRRGLALAMLAQVEAGIESALEHRYHRDVERRHGLPAARPQVRQQVGGRWIRADRLHEGFGVRIELDGEVAHPGGRTDDDVWRDNAVVLAHAEITLRYRWRHVVATPCDTAGQVVVALRAGGWTGRPRRCGPTCPVR